MDPPRSAQQRKADTLRRLERDRDLWVASASADGEAMLVPLSFHWHEGGLTLATPAATRTARNLLRAGVARVALGPTRDVVLIDGRLSIAVADALIDAYAAHTGWDPRQESVPHALLRLEPLRIQAWREVNELAGRHIMRDGSWVV